MTTDASTHTTVAARRLERGVKRLAVRASATDYASVGRRALWRTLSLPEDACNAVYLSAGYGGSVAAFSQVSLATDDVFGDDGGIHQLGTVTGSVADGFEVDMSVPVTTV